MDFHELWHTAHTRGFYRDWLALIRHCFHEDNWLTVAGYFQELFEQEEATEAWVQVTRQFSVQMETHLHNKRRQKMVEALPGLRVLFARNPNSLPLRNGIAHIEKELGLKQTVQAIDPFKQEVFKRMDLELLLHTEEAVHPLGPAV